MRQIIETEPTKLLTIKEAATRLGLTVSTLRRWVMTRKITFVRVGSKAVRFPEDVIDDIIRGGRTEAIIPDRP